MKYIILNHKCYLNYEEITKYKTKLEKIKTNNEVVLFPNMAYLSLFKNSKLNIGSQNFYSYNYGSYTGEVCLENLKDLNIHYTLVGHPERLLLNLDSYNVIKDKLLRSLKSNFKTILCVGHDESLKILKKELKFFFEGIEYSSLKNLIIAYEPSSKIDSIDADIEEVEAVCRYIKEYMFTKYDIDVPFIYGGSVNKDNIENILKITDGVIIGKYSTDINKLDELLTFNDKK